MDAVARFCKLQRKKILHRSDKKKKATVAMATTGMMTAAPIPSASSSTSMIHAPMPPLNNISRSIGGLEDIY
jgi:hypothetical protein